MVKFLEQLNLRNGRILLYLNEAFNDFGFVSEILGGSSLKRFLLSPSILFLMIAFSIIQESNKPVLNQKFYYKQLNSYMHHKEICYISLQIML